MIGNKYVTIIRKKKNIHIGYLKIFSYDESLGPAPATGKFLYRSKMDNFPFSLYNSIIYAL